MTGVIDSLFLDKVENLDRAKNSETVAQTVIELVLGQRQTTFGAL